MIELIRYVTISPRRLEYRQWITVGERFKSIYSLTSFEVTYAR